MSSSATWASREEEGHSKEGVHCTRAPLGRGGAERQRHQGHPGREGGTETDTGTRRKGAQRRGEKDATAPLPGTHGTHAQPLGSPEKASSRAQVGSTSMDARGGGAGHVACLPGTIFSSTSTLL